MIGSQVCCVCSCIVKLSPPVLISVLYLSLFDTCQAACVATETRADTFEVKLSILRVNEGWILELKLYNII